MLSFALLVGFGVALFAVALFLQSGRPEIGAGPAAPPAPKIPEVKTGAATTADLDQLASYVRTLGEECLRGVLIAGKPSGRVRTQARELGISIFTYSVALTAEPSPFEAIADSFALAAE